VRGPVIADTRARIQIRLARGNLICFRQFFQSRGYKANRRYTRGTHNVYDPGDYLKLQSAITANEDRTISPGSENLFQPAAQPLSLHTLLIDTQRTIGKHLNDDCRRLRIGLNRGCGLRQLHREAALLVRDDHKNDQQHQQDVYSATRALKNSIGRPLAWR